MVRDVLLKNPVRGQGAQAPCVASRWLDLAGCDLITYGTTASAEKFRDAAIARPLLVADGFAAADPTSARASAPWRK